MLEYYDYDDLSGIVTIYPNYLLLNKKMADLCADAYRIRLAIDVEQKKIYLFKLSKDKALEDAYNEKSLLKINIFKTYARIASKDVVLFLINRFNLNINNVGYSKFRAKYLVDDKAIVIDVKEEL